jgi:hypothetical protein
MNVKRLFSIVLLVVTSGGITAMAQVVVKDHSKFLLCHTTYALCTFSECGPAVADGNQETTTCACRIWQGYSVAARAPKGTPSGNECDGQKTTSDGQTTVISRYYPIPGYGVCSNNKPWAMCLDKLCTVDPNDKTKANCVCSVEDRQLMKQGHGEQRDYLVRNGSMCPSGIISSATVLDLHKITQFLKTKDEIPVQDFIVANPKQK